MLIRNQGAVDAAKQMIRAGQASCAVIFEDRIVEVRQATGIAPIVELYEAGMLKGAVIVDKIVGRAAAFVMALGGAAACYGLTVSAGAVAYLRDCGIAVQYDLCAQQIINRRVDGLCPMEDAVKDIKDAAEAYVAIKSRMAELAGKNKR